MNLGQLSKKLSELNETKNALQNAEGYLNELKEGNPSRGTSKGSDLQIALQQNAVNFLNARFSLLEQTDVTSYVFDSDEIPF